MNLSVVYSSDNHYAQHVGVSMISLFETNKEFNQIHVSIIDNHISINNRKNLGWICEKYNRTLEFIDFGELSHKLKLDIENSISISAYGRLFLSSVLKNVDKVLYLDCDSIVQNGLCDLWNIDITDYCVAGVLDTVSENTKLKINLGGNRAYINSGMLLMNLKKWRDEMIENKLIEYIDSYHGRVFHHDQGTLNGVLNEQLLILHPKYNCMTTFFTMTRDQMMKYYGMKEYYSETELGVAVNRPVFIHFTPAFVNRPWIKGCKHPLASLYKKYLDMTPWKGTDLLEDHRAKAEKFVAYLYTHLPFDMAYGICKKMGILT